jgi:hypothetical protein
MIEEQEYLKYGDKIAIKCLYNQMYVSLNYNENIVEASGYHPILYVSILSEFNSIKHFKERG